MLAGKLFVEMVIFEKKNDILDVFWGLFLLLITVVRLSFVQMFIVVLFCPIQNRKEFLTNIFLVVVVISHLKTY